MLDFGSSMLYKSKNKLQHIPYQHLASYNINNNNVMSNNNIDNTFTSVNTQICIQNSRRDDI